ncbi:unnamed protein product [Orchesella dallaii]|uniref:Metalloendopeptidase n=1 Tax=Orchesella dallaii TaxID=48710 RepID=A0ABP1RMC6_9HEXA
MHKCYGTMKLIFLSVLLTSFCQLSNSYRCETPEDWVETASHIRLPGSENSIPNADFANIRKGVKWPKGIVPYKFHASLTLQDIAEVRGAFEEYESKTCIKFKPWNEGDLDFVSIEVNQSVCGVAHVCKQGGYQFAQFGDPSERCRNKATMVHELGHTICLGHEQQRSDRDNYLSFPNCDKVPRKNPSGDYWASGIYDYSSQLHYDCNWCGGGWPKAEEVTKCGFEAESGLSPLDVDKINELYDCQGCHRHRWRPAKSLTREEMGNMYNFGYKLKDGTPLYPCRAPLRWEVSPGRYDIVTKSCHIGGWERTFVITENVEVLTIPGGLNKGCSAYKLTDRADVTRENGIVSSLSFRYTDARGYVTYGTLKNESGVEDNALGKVWLWDKNQNFQNYAAELQHGTVTGFQENYKVLTCSFDQSCAIKKLMEGQTM